MAIINCPECGKSISSNAKQCPHCGSPFYICPNCGKISLEMPSVCPVCGTAHQKAPTAEEIAKKDEKRKNFLESVEQAKRIVKINNVILILFAIISLLLILASYALTEIWVGKYKNAYQNGNGLKLLDLTLSATHYSRLYTALLIIGTILFFISTTTCLVVDIFSTKWLREKLSLLCPDTNELLALAREYFQRSAKHSFTDKHIRNVCINLANPQKRTIEKLNLCISIFEIISFIPFTVIFGIMINPQVKFEATLNNIEFDYPYSYLLAWLAAFVIILIPVFICNKYQKSINKKWEAPKLF